MMGGMPTASATNTANTSGLGAWWLGLNNS